jgi:hypothetical protein
VHRRSHGIDQLHARDAPRMRSVNSISSTETRRATSPSTPAPAIVVVIQRELPGISRPTHGQMSAGSASPTRPASPLPPSTPGYQASAIAATCSAAHERSSGRPFTSTSAIGFPIAATSSNNSCCPFDNVNDDREAASPLIMSSSAKTSTSTSLCFADATASSLALPYEVKFQRSFLRGSWRAPSRRPQTRRDSTPVRIFCNLAKTKRCVPALTPGRVQNSPRKSSQAG